ncbi:tetratricopeptide repeat protein [Rhodoblastus sp.]|uniref:tetratricopeptide repeat protein n=1 Tax=Rhodoblastus sp. TaxID=1962975 RepID=UPI0035B13917
MIGRTLLIAALMAGTAFAGAARAESAAAKQDAAAAGNAPSELSVEYWAERSKEARFDPGMCMYGYPLAKMGWHDAARRIFERCAEHDNVYAMAWAAWTEENGYDQPSDPIKAAEWDKRLADTGSSLGQFNYGLDLLRGHGVDQDRALGKDYIDKAAAGGDKTAKELAQHDYDPESVTPTADLAHYRKPQF